MCLAVKQLKCASGVEQIVNNVELNRIYIYNVTYLFRKWDKRMSNLQLEPVDPNSKVAYYLQMKDALLERIEKDELKAGDKLPSEANLCKALNVSRTVVRQALMELEHDGLIYKRKGKGAYITEPKVKVGLARLQTGFTQDISSQGGEVETEVISSNVVAAPSAVAKILHLSPEDKVIEILRLRKVNHQPLVLVTTYLPHEPCKDLVDADLTLPLYDSLKTLCNIELAFNTQNIEATLAEASQAKALEVKTGAALLKLTRVSYCADQTPMEYSVAFHRGDRALLQASLVRVKDHKLPEDAPSSSASHIFYSTD